MIELLFQIGLSNVVIAMLLAGVALVVEMTSKRPQLAHLLWLLVFIKLLTPAFMTVPLDFLALQPASLGSAASDYTQQELIVTASEFVAGAAPVAVNEVSFATVVHSALPWLAGLWLLGSLIMLARSLWRVYRFNCLLRAASAAAPSELQAVASGLAERLRLRVVPELCLTSAAISPLVWWLGGKVRIVIPASLLEQLDSEQSRWILAHELAHVRRKDHLIRWIEWLACVCFWWNPLVWWARHHLRANEELCCDALVLSSLKPDPLTYAESLLTAIECLTCPVIRPPAVVSEINSGGILERRLKMIVSKTPKLTVSYWVLGAVILCALAILPISFGLGGSSIDQANAATELEEDHNSEHGDLTQEEADAKLKERREQAGQEAEREIEKHTRQESITDYYLSLGFGTEDFDRLVTALTKGGITAEQLDGVLGSTLRIASMRQQQGAEFVLDPVMQEYLTGKLGLSDEQLKLVVGVSGKVAALMPDLASAPPNGDLYYVRVVAHAGSRVVFESEMNLNVPFSGLASCTGTFEDEFGVEYQKLVSAVHILSNERRADAEPLQPEIAAALEAAVRIEMGEFVVDAWLPDAERIEVKAWKALVAEPGFPSGAEPAASDWEFYGEGSIESRPLPVE